MANEDEKNLVASAYDAIADDYNSWATANPSSRDVYLAKILPHITSSSHVLELGCGAGLPITKVLVQHIKNASNATAENGPNNATGSVTGNDISNRQIALAQKNVPEAQFISGDMTKLAFEKESLDAVVAFFSIFHLPRDEQPEMLRLIANWLKPGGWFVASLATSDSPEVKFEWFGTDMYWSSFDVQGNQKMLKDAGLEIVEAEVLISPDEVDEPFWWVLAKKPT